MKFPTYLKKVQKHLSVHDGAKVCGYISLEEARVRSSYADCRETQTNYRSQFVRTMPKPWDELLTNLFSALAALESADHVEAYTQFHGVVSILNRMLVSCDRWILPVVYITNRQLYHLSVKADQQLVEAGQKTGRLEDATRTINRTFSLCTTDRHPLHTSRKWGTYYLAGLLFAQYFRLHTRHLCTNVLRSMKMAELPAFSEFPLAHQVRFKYYTGLLDFYNGNYEAAEESLQFAFEHCRYDSRANKERILAYLIPTYLYRGVLPSASLLGRYLRLKPIYQPFALAIRTGDISLYDTALQLNEGYLLRKETYLALEQARVLAARTLLKKTYLVAGRTTRLPFTHYQAALRTVGVESDLAEVECLLAGMIYKGLVKGYMAHEQGMLVLSKDNPFPSLKSIYRPKF